MERGSQIFRFTIPGALFVLTGVAVYAFAKVLWGEHLSDIHALSAITTSIAAIAASIPIGFLGYQLYYWRYSPDIFGRYVTRDQGRDALVGLPKDVLDDIRVLFNARLDVRRNHELVNTLLGRRLKLLKLNKSLMRDRYKVKNPENRQAFEWDERKISRIYKDNWYENWDVFRALLDLVGAQGKRPEIKENFMSLYDIYHALGASRLAVPLGAFGACAYLAWSHRSEEIHMHPLRSIAGLIFVTIVTVLFFFVLHQTRIATWRSAIHKVRFDLRSCFETDTELRKLIAESSSGSIKPRRKFREKSNERLRKYRRPMPRRLVRRPALALQGEIGSINWARTRKGKGQDKGLLTRKERRRFRLAAGMTVVFDFPWLLMAHFRHASGPDPSRVKVPRTKLAKEVERMAECSLDKTLLDHSYRSYLFARCLATVEGEQCDDEALFAATMLHELALLDVDSLGDRCFTVAGVERVEGFLNSVGFEEERLSSVLDAITLQLNPVVDLERHGSVQRFAHAGILFDIFGIRAKELDPEGVARVFDRYPREEFTGEVRDMLKKHAKKSKMLRTHILLAAGLRWSLRLNPWRKVEHSERLAKLKLAREAERSL